jgi:hypothetical protein
MTVRTRSAPPPRAIDTSAAEQGRAHKLWNGRAGCEASEDEVIATILAVEAPNLNAEMRGAQRSTAKAALRWLEWCRVLTQIEPGIYRWASEFPEWPERSHAEVQARDRAAEQREHEEAREREQQEQAAQRERTNPNRELERRIGAVEVALADLQQVLSSQKRHAESEAVTARLDQLRRRQGRDPSPPVEPGEEGRTHEQSAEPR